ncbi:MAG: hydantoinase/oxoprolinase family protein [Candidatus Methanomethylophilaceae archaeon]
MVYGLGIDTGGTYTDAVVMDIETGEVLVSHKSPTTHEDLTIGIRGSIEGLSDEILAKVGVVSLSSTLATNSVVEGKGCRVGLVAIGHEFNSKYQADEETVIKGRHDLLGRETEPLDVNAADKFLRSIRGKVDGVAISGYLGVRNSEHELKVRKMAYEILGVRTVCGHELSSTLGFDDRTTTCIMNARLIPLIDELIVAVKHVMKERNILAPLMMVKGDGSMMGESEASIRPVETILSGPASSLIGAGKLTGIEDAIVVDIGGTTTDIGILRGGRPDIVEYGAILGGMRTHVKAADISTVGLGGDSHIVVLGSGVRISTVRCVPLCFAARKWPDITDALRKVSTMSPMFRGEFDEDARNFQETDFFVRLKDNKNNIELSAEEKMLIKFLNNGPRTLGQASRVLKVHPLLFKVNDLENMGLVQRIGLTPTDILCADGKYNEFDPEPAKLAIKHFSRAYGVSEEKLISMVKKMLTEKIVTEIVGKVLDSEVGSRDMGAAGRHLLKTAVSLEQRRDYSCSIKLSKPIIGIGAPAGAYLPEVSKRLGTDFVLPKYSDVGNAVGAVTGGIIEREEILIKPHVENAVGDVPCTVFARFGRFIKDSISEGIEFARTRGTEYVREMALKDGAEDVVVTDDVRISKIRAKNMPSEFAVIDVTVTVTAAGKPKMFQV